MLPGATHKTFYSSYCAMLQSSGALAQASSRAILDQHTATLIATSPPGGNSGKAVQICAEEFLTDARGHRAADDAARDAAVSRPCAQL